MKNDILASLTHLSDAELVARVKSLVARERDATAHLVAHLAEMDTRDVHLREGYNSLFVYCRDVLGLSEGESYNRIEVARAARRFPVILEMLATGAVNLTAARLLAPHLTLANHREVLESARGKKKSEVEEIVARLAPRPDVAASVRKLPAPSLLASLPEAGRVETPVISGASDPAAPAPSELDLIPQPMPVPRASVQPLSPDRYKLQLTIGGETLEKLRLAQDMLGHAIPSGDDAAVLDRALTALLVELAKRKFSDTRKPRRPRAKNPRAREASAAEKRAVWVRDLGRCAYIGPSGHRCNERRFVEFHHVDPYALGGETTLDNIQLRCRRHNDYEGRLYFGKRRCGDADAVRENASAAGEQRPFERADLFQNKFAGASLSPRTEGVEPRH
jgi:HNH endonuclease